MRWTQSNAAARSRALGSAVYNDAEHPPAGGRRGRRVTAGAMATARRGGGGRLAAGTQGREGSDGECVTCPQLLSMRRWTRMLRPAGRVACSAMDGSYFGARFATSPAHRGKKSCADRHLRLIRKEQVNKQSEMPLDRMSITSTRSVHQHLSTCPGYLRSNASILNAGNHPRTSQEIRQIAAPDPSQPPSQPRNPSEPQRPPLSDGKPGGNAPDP